MLTFFTAPKPFHGHIGQIQKNAIRSWRALKGAPPILIIGNEEGIEEICNETEGVRHIPLDYHKIYPTVPCLNRLFQKAREEATTPYLCYINADIILFDDFMDAFEKVQKTFESFLMISSRYNMDVTEDISIFNDTLKNHAKELNHMYPCGGTDFFVFSRDLFKTLPSFLLGRGYWDNWLMYRAVKEGGTLVNVTQSVVALHQNHDYSHALNNKSRDEDDIYYREQGLYNYNLCGGFITLYNAYDSSHELTPHGFQRLPLLKRIQGMFMRYLIPLIRLKRFLYNKKGSS